MLQNQELFQKHYPGYNTEVHVQTSMLLEWSANMIMNQFEVDFSQVPFGVQLNSATFQIPTKKWTQLLFEW